MKDVWLPLQRHWAADEPNAATFVCAIRMLHAGMSGSTHGVDQYSWPPDVIMPSSTPTSLSQDAWFTQHSSPDSEVAVSTWHALCGWEQGRSPAGRSKGTPQDSSLRWIDPLMFEQGGLFATFCEKIGDPLNKECFTRGSIIFPPKAAKMPPVFEQLTQALLRRRGQRHCHGREVPCLL